VAELELLAGLAERGEAALEIVRQERRAEQVVDRVALAHVALADFSSLVTLAGEIPLEGTSREVKPLKKVA